MPTIFKKKPFLLPDEDEPYFRLDDMDAAVPASAGTGQPEATATELMQAPLPPLESLGVQPRWTALDQYSDTVSQRPQLKRPSGWKGALQTVGEVALGQMYGPVASERIMHPKYTRQMDEYGDAVGEAKAQAEIEGQFIKRGVDQAKLESQQSVNARRGATADKQSAVAQKQLENLEKPGYKAVGSMGYVTPEGKFVEAPRAAEKETPEQATTRRTKEADTLNLKGDVRTNYIAGRNVTGRAKSGGDGRKQANPATFSTIENRKGEDFKAIAKKTEKAIAALDKTSIVDKEMSGESKMSASEKAALRAGKLWDIYDTERKQKLAALNNYYNSVLAAGGDVEARDTFPPLMPKDEFIASMAGAGTTATKPTAPTAPTAAPQGPPPLPALEKQGTAKKTYTEAEVRQRAAAQGIDPNVAVSKAKAAGLLR